MLGITDSMRFDFTMMREMSNRTRFDSGQGGASVETGHQSMNLTTLRGHAVESKTNQRHSEMGRRDQRISPMCRIESQAELHPAPSVHP
ncbi:uncharacterized protein TNCV_2681191 [Trichonephila clavipes]|uniref:Uncharacterized protein n=1 Tax=Trichonephila clavipes TaxID=2585209 RepID=A0A8X6S7Q1_TRICX|nr:uncharacterized protein TNCV_2681191 [Trichonephila clavipes]